MICSIIWIGHRHQFRPFDRRRYSRGEISLADIAECYSVRCFYSDHCYYDYDFDLCSESAFVASQWLGDVGKVQVPHGFSMRDSFGSWKDSNTSGITRFEFLCHELI